MSRWKTSFESQELLKRVETILGQLQAISTQGVSASDLAEYARLTKVLQVLDARLSNLDPELFSHNFWGAITNHLTTIQSNIQNFSQHRNTGAFPAANNAVDQILDILKPADVLNRPLSEKALSDASSGFSVKVIEELERIRSRAKEIETALHGLNDTIAQGKKRLEENNQVIERQKGRLDQSIAEFQKQFSDAQEKRSTEFSEQNNRNSVTFASQTKEFEKQFSEKLLKERQEFELFFQTIRQDGDTHLALLKKREDEVNQIFGAIGATAFAGNFKNTADIEAKAADLWRWIALGLMAAMIAVAMFAFYYSIAHSPDWRVFGFRLGTVLVLSIPAAYAANESSKHRERERLNRKIHLELASIDAYLVLLPEAERNKIKGTLAEKFFGVLPVKEGKEEVTQKDLLGVVSTVVNNLTKGK